MLGWLVVFWVSAEANGANILGIFPFTAKSHYAMYEPLLSRLHERGHNLTVLSHFQRDVPTERFSEISLAGTVPSLHGNLSLSHLDEAPLNLKDNLRQIHQNEQIFDAMLSSDRVQKLLRSPLKFDLVIVELFDTDIFLAFAHKFRAPYISISPCPLLPWARHRVGDPSNPSYVPVFFSPFANEMDIGSRALNALYYVASNLYYSHVMMTESERIVRKHFPDCPPLSRLAEEVSLILYNTHSSLHRPAPASPRLKQVGGMHIREPQPLRDELLLNFLETADQGVILFSMGSMFRAESLSREKAFAFDRALKRLPQRVIWKRESTVGKAVNGNVLYMDWVPQRDVLAHRNVVLFIYHGGLLGVTEAVHCGVPILGIPMFGDMPVNMAAVTSAGAGVSIPFRDITDDLLYNTINRMINDSSYKLKARALSQLYSDRPMPPLQSAVYWTEYVIRHRGAPHLKPHSLAWYQLWFLDLILVASATCFASLALARQLLRWTYRLRLKIKKL